MRVILLMYFSDAPADAPQVCPPSKLTVAVIAVPLIITFVLGMFPQPVLDLVESAGFVLS